MFHEYQSDYYMEMTTMANWELVSSNVIASHQAGNDFDLMSVNHVDVLAYIRGGLIQTIQPFMDNSGVNFNDIIFPNLLEAGMYQNRQYTLPINTDTRVIAVNLDLLAQHGQTVPTTMDEFVEASRAVTQDGNFGFVLHLTANPYISTYDMGIFLRSIGGQLYVIEPDGRAVATIDTPEMREYFEFVLTMLNYMPGDTLTIVGDDSRRYFASGNIAFYMYGPWELNLMPDLDFNYELIRVPAGPNGSRSNAGGFHWGMGSGSQHSEGAWEFMRFTTTNPELLGMAAIASGLPTAPASYDLPPFNSGAYDIFLEQLAYSGLPQIPVANLPEVVSEFHIYWEDLLFGNITVEEAVTQAQVSVQAVLDRMN